ncbi:MAG: GntR family transcriptional regulator [Mobilicoccus sp.]|nr:GntR family transcriptional regulator [Mobilicoccus sp.]
MEFDPSRPIWHQLVQEFSRRIVTGEWASGARIGGVRELAGDLGVNPNTVQRALSELERDGLCRSERTAGRFVTDDETRVRALRRTLAADAADEFITRAKGFGIPRSDATALVTERWADHDDHPSTRPASEPVEGR